MSQPGHQGGYYRAYATDARGVPQHRDASLLGGGSLGLPSSVGYGPDVDQPLALTSSAIPLFRIHHDDQSDGASHTSTEDEARTASRERYPPLPLRGLPPTPPQSGRTSEWLRDTNPAKPDTGFAAPTPLPAASSHDYYGNGGGDAHHGSRFEYETASMHQTLDSASGSAMATRQAEPLFSVGSQLHGSSGMGLPQIPNSSPSLPVASAEVGPSFREVAAAHDMKRDWKYSVLFSVFDFFVCTEVYCCQPCQLLRQAQLLQDRGSGLSFFQSASLIGAAVLCSPVILGYLWLGWWTPLCFPCAAIIRSKVRERYRISGTIVWDCGASVCCTCCVVAQVLREMTTNREFPGACCYDEPPPVPLANATGMNVAPMLA